MSEPRARFLVPGSVPPIGYVYQEEHDGETYRFQASTRFDLLARLRQWYRTKEKEWPGDKEMEARIEDYICQLVPSGFCKGGPSKPRVPFLSSSSIRDASRLLISGLKQGRKILVDKTEADRRALICANCPANLHGICTSCMGTEFQSIFRALLTRGASTKYDSVLDTCSVCGCLLKAKVHISLDELAKLSKKTYPENCWLHGTACHEEKPNDR